MAYVYWFGSLYFLNLGLRECLSSISEKYAGNRNQKVGVIKFVSHASRPHLFDELFKKAHSFFFENLKCHGRVL